ncbi:hypothetical protein [Paenibacillus eucommiae]|uniref:Uncharacterized protein n=1 Tax=Paenibacillus eucommiae TaxID=1355755 RepID=A0ABS4J8S5_9BACL|nr:hypothetical protein [Paenibacillus eucommiae]MBP1996253.1 hypothetical protein [Paenibacillus eucommiae]
MIKILETIICRDMLPEWNELLQRPDELVERAMTDGFEAEVKRIDRGVHRYVMKTWSKVSRPDIRVQYQLLKWLFRQGMAVPKPIAWGVHRENRWPVLVTTFEGECIKKADVETITRSAQLLVEQRFPPTVSGHIDVVFRKRD